MAATRPLLLFYMSILLFLCLIKFTPVSQYLVSLSPKQPQTILQLDIAFYSSKRNNDDVFPAIGLTQNSNRKVWSLNGVLISEQKMVVLTEKNFSNFITQNQHVLVVFYSSKYFWRKRLSPESSAAAMKRKGNLVIAKVDAEKEKLLTKKYKIGSYPTAYFFYYGFIDEFYEIWIPAEAEKTKLTKCQEDEDQTNFDAPLKELQEPIRSYEEFTTLEDAPVEDEAPSRSDEKIIWKIEYIQPGVVNMYPVLTSGQSTEIADLDKISDVKRETKFPNRLKELQEPVKSYGSLRETGKSTLDQNEIGEMSMVGEFMEDDKNLKSSTNYKTNSGSTNLRWIPLETENDAKEEEIDEPAPKISGKSTNFSQTWTAW